MKHGVIDALVVIGFSMVLALTMSNCSGCALIVPEGTMTMEVSADE